MYTSVLLSSKLYQMIWSSKGTLDRLMFNRSIKKEEHKQFILVHPYSRATFSLPYHTSKENFTKIFNCTITISHTVLTPCKNQEHHWTI